MRRAPITVANVQDATPSSGRFRRYVALTRTIAESVHVPVIAGGGAGTTAHVREVVAEGHADAVSLASLLHYNRLRHCDDDDDFAAEGNTEFLKRGGSYSRIQDASLRDVKLALNDAGIECRYGVAS